MRVRNNLAAALSNDEPVRATTLSLDGAELARQVGDCGMYNWLTAMTAFGVRAEARRWDEYIEQMREALDLATVRSDRLRLKAGLVAAFEGTRGEKASLEDARRELEMMLEDSTDPEDQWMMTMGISWVALMSNDANMAYRLATDAEKVDFQSSEGATQPGISSSHLGREPRMDPLSRGPRSDGAVERPAEHRVSSRSHRGDRVPGRACRRGLRGIPQKRLTP